MKLLVVEVDENNSAYSPMAHPNFWVSAILSVREFPTTEQLGRVALAAHRHSDNPEVIGRDILNAIFTKGSRAR